MSPSAQMRNLLDSFNQAEVQIQHTPTKTKAKGRITADSWRIVTETEIVKKETSPTKTLKKSTSVTFGGSLVRPDPDLALALQVDTDGLANLVAVPTKPTKVTRTPGLMEAFLSSPPEAFKQKRASLAAMHRRASAEESPSKRLKFLSRSSSDSNLNPTTANNIFVTPERPISALKRANQTGHSILLSRPLKADAGPMSRDSAYFTSLNSTTASERKQARTSAFYPLSRDTAPMSSPSGGMLPPSSPAVQEKDTTETNPVARRVMTLLVGESKGRRTILPRRFSLPPTLSPPSSQPQTHLFELDDSGCIVTNATGLPRDVIILDAPIDKEHDNVDILRERLFSAKYYMDSDYESEEEQLAKPQQVTDTYRTPSRRLRSASRSAAKAKAKIAADGTPPNKGTMDAVLLGGEHQCIYCSARWGTRRLLKRHKRNCETRNRVKKFKERKSQTETEINSEEDDGELNCLCGGTVDNVPMVQCEQCRSWLHIHCLNEKEEDLPEAWYCPSCERDREPMTPPPAHPQSPFHGRLVPTVDSPRRDNGGLRSEAMMGGFGTPQIEQRLEAKETKLSSTFDHAEWHMEELYSPAALFGLNSPKRGLKSPSFKSPAMRFSPIQTPGHTPSLPASPYERRALNYGGDFTFSTKKSTMAALCGGLALPFGAGRLDDMVGVSVGAELRTPDLMDVDDVEREML